MAGVVKQIIGSFEDIGKDVARETAKVPKDMVGSALESLGTSQSVKNPPVKPQQKKEDARVSKASARAALEQFARPVKTKESTVQERLEKEEFEKREKDAKKAKTAEEMAPLPTVTTKPKRGNLYGIKQKVSSEMSKNVRQD